MRSDASGALSHVSLVARKSPKHQPMPSPELNAASSYRCHSLANSTLNDSAKPKSPSSSSTEISHSIEFRVQYYETDGQTRVHHGQYINYFERGRVELLRACGQNYKDIEEDGLFLVVSEMNVQYLGSAEFDDLLRLTTCVLEVRGVRIRHGYSVVKVHPNGSTTPVVEGSSVVACVDRGGKVRRLPPTLRDARLASAE
jgi:acyl-CoA thioester hydrolase